MILLSLAGQAGTGKDAVADYLAERYGFIKFSFSDALYAEVAAAFNLPDESLLRDRATKEAATPLLALENCTDQAFVELATEMLDQLYPFPKLLAPWLSPNSPRKILQWWGTEYCRAQDPDYWVKKAHCWLYAMHSAAPYPELRPYLFVNTSCRFENEREWTHAQGGNIWHVHRDEAAPVAGHTSEVPLPVLEGEREIFNNYTLEYLYKGVDQLLSSSAKFVRLEPPLPMVEPDEEAGYALGLFTGEKNLSYGMYYSMQPDGHNMLCNADGTRSIFDDVDE